MKAIIFDRDGIILNSESTNINSALKAFKSLNIEIAEKEKVWIIGTHPEDYKTLFLEKYNFSYKEFRKIQKATYDKLIDLAPLFEKTISFIKKLQKLNITLALTTSSNADNTIKVLERVKLKDVFDVIITYEDCKKRKPDPEPYLITAEKLHLDPKDCVVIEDTTIGLEAAKAAGMKCVVIPNEYTKQQDFSQADLIVASADELNLDLLNQL